ncbi:hypothetical protein D3C87_2162540 [compost metagenome]
MKSYDLHDQPSCRFNEIYLVDRKAAMLATTIKIYRQPAITIAVGEQRDALGYLW